MDNSENNSCKHNGLVRILVALIALGSALAFTNASAQTPTGNAAVQQARLFNQRPGSATSTEGERLFPPLDTYSNGISAADLDVGEQWMLKSTPPVNPFTVRTSFSLFYTNNVALARSATLEDAFAVADFAIGYSRPIAPDWAFAIDLQQSFFRYDRYTEFDFESSNASVAVSHQARQLGNVVFSLQYGVSRLTRGAVDDQLFLGNTVALAATKVVQATTASSVDLNAAIGYTFADPEDLARAELRVAIGYTLRVARNFTATAVARLELFDYTNKAREDYLQSVALGARWDLTEWMFVSASVSAVNNMSTERVFSYGAINGGATLTAHLRF